MRALLVVAVLSVPAFADVDPSTVKPADAVAKMEATYTAAKGITATVDQTVMNTMSGGTQTSKATLVEDHGKFAADYTNKKGALDKSFYFDGKSGWMVDHGGLKATSVAADSSMLPVFARILAGEKGAIAKEFTIGPPSDPSDLVPGTATVELKPKAASAKYQSVLVVIDPTNWSVERVVVTDPQKNVTIYVLTDIDLKAKVDPKKFTFDPKQFPTYAIEKAPAPTVPKKP